MSRTRDGGAAVGSPLSRRSVLRGAAALSGSVLLTACGQEHGGSPAGGPGTITVTDQRGKTLAFDEPVTRIVTMPMPAASIVIAVDRTASHLVGMHEASWVAVRDGVMGEMFPGALDVAHDVEGQSFAPNLESILTLEPDVVVQWADTGSGVIAPMENAGLEVLGVTYGTQEDVTTWLTLFATMLGKPERARTMINRMEAESKRVAERTAALSAPPPKICYFNRFASELKVAGRGTYNDYYINLVGGTNPATGSHGVSGQGMVGVSVEQVLAWDPDIVLLGNFDAAMPSDVYDDTVWRNMSAVQSRRVYKVPLGGYRWDPPSHESPLMWHWLSRVAFPGDDETALREKVVDYYLFLYDEEPTSSQMDQILWADANSGSAHYQQFDAA